MSPELRPIKCAATAALWLVLGLTALDAFAQAGGRPLILDTHRDSQRRGRYRSANCAAQWLGVGPGASAGNAARTAAARSTDDRGFALHRTSAGRAGIRLFQGIAVIALQLWAPVIFGVAAFRRILRRAERHSNASPNSNAASIAANPAVFDRNIGTHRSVETRRNAETCGYETIPLIGPAQRDWHGRHVARLTTNDVDALSHRGVRV